MTFLPKESLNNQRDARGFINEFLHSKFDKKDGSKLVKK